MLLVELVEKTPGAPSKAYVIRRAVHRKHWQRRRETTTELYSTALYCLINHPYSGLLVENHGGVMVTFKKKKWAIQVTE